MTYQLTTGTSIKRLSDGAFIPPMTPATATTAIIVEYQAWLAATPQSLLRPCSIFVTWNPHQFLPLNKSLMLLASPWRNLKNYSD
jgi:hypothetical protein